jgi:hypothetical protein
MVLGRRLYWDLTPESNRVGLLVPSPLRDDLILGIGCATALVDAKKPSEGDVRHPRQHREISPVECASTQSHRTDHARESDRRRGLQSSNGNEAGRDQNTPIWWVTVAGYFRFQGMAAPTTARVTCTRQPRVFSFDDPRTGHTIGPKSLIHGRWRVRLDRLLLPTPAPCATPVPAPTVRSGTGPTANLYDRTAWCGGVTKQPIALRFRRSSFGSVG